MIYIQFPWTKRNEETIETFQHSSNEWHKRVFILNRLPESLLFASYSSGMPEQMPTVSFSITKSSRIWKFLILFSFKHWSKSLQNGIAATLQRNFRGSLEKKVQVRAKKKQNWFWMILKGNETILTMSGTCLVCLHPALPRNWSSESANSHQHFAKTTKAKYSIITVCSSVIHCVSVTWISKRVCMNFKSKFFTFLYSFKLISLKHARVNCVSSHISSYNKELLLTITMRYVCFSSFKDFNCFSIQIALV